MNREKVSKTVKIGGFSHVRSTQIGGDNPIIVQTMWKEHLSQKPDNQIVDRIENLGDMGCGLLRFAVPDLQTAETVGRIAEMVSMPLAADIHFDHKIALHCMNFPIAKIRINPGNIGNREQRAAVLEKAAEKNIPIRIGVNAGSLPKDLRKTADFTAQVLVQAAERELAIFKEFGFSDVLVSMKASGIADTIDANRILSEKTDVPLHLGVTEAGPLVSGIVRSTTALITLLKEGIGDTIRVSLSDTMENEVIAGNQIIKAALELPNLSKKMAVRLNSKGVKIISCPRCGRYGFDTHGFTNRWAARLYSLKKDITIAIMGCEVNGPQEAKHADLGITGIGNKILIFKHGQIIKTIDSTGCISDIADKAFEEELLKF